MRSGDGIGQAALQCVDIDLGCAGGADFFELWQQAAAVAEVIVSGLRAASIKTANGDLANGDLDCLSEARAALPRRRCQLRLVRQITSW